MTKDASLTVRLEPDLKASYEAQAAALDMKLSALVVRTLRRAARRWQANGPAGAQADEATPARRNHADDHDSNTRVNGRAD